MAEKLRLRLFRLVMGMFRRGWLAWLPDEAALRLQYFLKLGRRLNLKHPRLYNEKLQWLKLHDRNPAYHQLVDKVAVRDFVRERVGEEYLIPAIAVCDSPEEIDWAALPDKFVVKCAHGSSSNIVCEDKSKLDVAAAMEKLRRWMRYDWFTLSREWPYRGVRPRILIERFLEGDGGGVPYDYKLMCFSGEPEFIIVDADRFTAHTRNYYDKNWVLQEMFNRHPNCPREIPRPAALEEMLDVARRLSRGIPHVRVDLYCARGRVWFGEMTFFHGFGMEVFRPRAFEERMGDLIRLNEKRNEK